MGIMERYLCLYDELGFHYKTGFIYKRIRKPGKVFYTIPGTTPNAVQVETGEHSGITVLDLDVHDGVNGNDQIKSGWIPENTACVQSQNGEGRHYYFSYMPEIKTSTNKEKGIDIRNNGAVIYSPPSIVRAGGVYKWIIEPSKGNLKPIPKDLYNFLAGLQSEKRNNRTFQKIPFHGMKSILDLTEKQRQIIREKLEACEAEKGYRSEKDFGLCCFAIGAGLNPEELWTLCRDVGKFMERGRAYFDLTFNNALKTI